VPTERRIESAGNVELNGIVAKIGFNATGASLQNAMLIRVILRLRAGVGLNQNGAGDALI
jgi:hypothetical protein